MGALGGGGWGALGLPDGLECGFVVQPGDAQALELVLGVVVQLLYRVPAYAPLGDVAVKPTINTSRPVHSPTKNNKLTFSAIFFPCPATRKTLILNYQI